MLETTLEWCHMICLWHGNFDGGPNNRKFPTQEMTLECHTTWCLWHVWIFSRKNWKFVSHEFPSWLFYCSHLTCITEDKAASSLAPRCSWLSSSSTLIKRNIWWSLLLLSLGGSLSESSAVSNLNTNKRSTIRVSTRLAASTTIFVFWIATFLQYC